MNTETETETVTMTAISFLESIGEEQLVAQSILITRAGQSLLLTGDSVAPLLVLLKEKNIDRLTNAKGDWWLEATGYYRNQKSAGPLSGHFESAPSTGCVFTGMNSSINPYYGGKTSTKKHFRDIEIRQVLDDINFARKRLDEAYSLLESMLPKKA